MASVIRVVVEGGGHNLYYIRRRHDEYQIYHHRVGLIWDDENLVGTADDSDEAIEMIKSHSGEDIDSADGIDD